LSGAGKGVRMSVNVKKFFGYQWFYAGTRPV
jgi:hypothetical protein